MWKFLKAVNKNLIVAIPVLMVAGFITGLLINAAPLKQLIVPLTFLMVYPMMVTLKIKQVFKGGDGKAQLLTQIINFGDRLADTPTPTTTPTPTLPRRAALPILMKRW